MEEIILFLFVVIILICFTLLLLSDYLVIKRRLKNCKPIVAKIIYFDEIQFFRSGYHVSIVEYENDGKNRNAVVLKARGDGIGDEIEIVTDGNLAVRNKIVIKEDNNWSMFLVAFVVLLFGRENIIEKGEQFLVVLLFSIIVLLLITIIFYPFIYEVFDGEIKKNLGWHR